MKARRQRRRLLALTISFLLFPITIFYFSPALIVMGAFQGVVAAAGVMFALQLLCAIILRRAFCGWVCPAGGLQEIEARSVGKPFRNTHLNLLKWTIWIPWIISIVAGFVLAGGIRSIDFLFHIDRGISVSDLSGLAIYFGIVVVFFVPNIFLGKRAMCHSICWMAPFMIIGSKIGNVIGLPQLHVEAEPDACIDCGRCNGACPMSLDVESEVKAGIIGNPECIQCATCCDVCPKSVLSLRVSAIQREPSNK